MTVHDIRLAVRSLVHDRSVSAIVILCLALGIGVNATLFSVIDGVLIQPLPFPEPDRLVVVNEISERRGIRETGVSFAVVNGGLNLAIANGGPGTGNGVVGGAAAFVLGLVALAIGGLALARCRRTALEPGRVT